MAGSGDLLADRRYAYAEAAFGEGDHATAADLAHQALEIAPRFAPAWFLLGKAREELSRRTEEPAEASGHFRDAVAAFEEALVLEPADRLGARLRLAALGVGDPAAAMAADYVRALFDDYAIRFDRHLVRSLKYRAPELLLEAVRRICGQRLRPVRFGLALDLGCGTGLAGERFRAVCDRLAGIDLSPAMLAKAEVKRLYDELAPGDITDWLRSRPAASSDLVLAADVLVYLGDLSPVFAETARVLVAGGLFAFTAQAHPDDEVRLGEDMRYAHGEAYLRRLAERHGFEVACLDAVSTREDRGEPVPGLLAVLVRR